MKKIIVMTAKLLLITVVAGLILGVVNAVTKEPIAAQEAKAAKQARLDAFPAADHFELLEIDIPAEYAIIQNIYVAKDSAGNDIGITAGVITKGYSPGLNMTVGLSADGSITGIAIGSHQETPGLGAKAADPAFSGQFTDKSYAKYLVIVKREATNPNEIEAITAATITSDAITYAVNDVVDFYKESIGGAL